MDGIYKARQARAVSQSRARVYSPRWCENVRFGSLADITARSRHVRFTPGIRHVQREWHVRYVPEADIQRQSDWPEERNQRRTDREQS